MRPPHRSSPPKAAPPPEPPKAATPPGTLDAAAVRRVWEEILSYVGRKRRAAAAVAREATVREVDGDTLVLLFKHGVHANMLTNGPELLIEAVYEILGPPSSGAKWQVRCEVSGQGRSGGTPAPAGRPDPVPPAPRTAEPGDAGGWPDTARPGGPAPTPASRAEPERSYTTTRQPP